MKEKKMTSCCSSKKQEHSSGEAHKKGVKADRHNEKFDMDEEMISTMGLLGGQLDNVCCKGEDLEQGSEFITTESVISKEK